MIQEMLEVDIIQPSQSYFSSKVVMVTKKGCPWCMCPNYRHLNKMTIKDKFPILVIDELLHELQGEFFFAKLDLHSKYHHIRIRKEGIPKISFRTHEAHYEFLVISFGLTNAPYTFQIFLNYIFKPFLRKSILVFFDDIPIYNKSWEDHV
jgi:hypothetical protein